ncbi:MULTISPECIES: hypothetical protein [Curtobacterium]|uniref:hypothetical protein n=1 Tax=Curtobacterium flaccumfaciens TaxID=2035 RepID=UPI003107B94D
MKRMPLITALAVAALASVALSSCSANDAAPERDPKPTASPTVTPIETVYDKCEDGFATILTSNTKAGETFTLGDCENVSIVGLGAKGSTFELGKVGTLVIEGDSVRADVASAKKIIVAGQENTVTHDGGADVQDDGAKNTVTAR